MAIVLTQGRPGEAMSLVCPPPAVIGTPRTVTAPVGPVRGVGTRPFTALYLELRKHRIHAEVNPPAEYRLYSLEFSRALLSLVDKAKFAKDGVQLHDLAESIDRLVTVYVARLISDRDHRLPPPPGGLTGLFECLDDFRVFSVRYASLYKSGLHAAAFAGYVRLFRYFPKFLKAELLSL